MALEILQGESLQGHLGSKNAEHLHGKDQALQRADAEVADGTLNIGNGARNAKEGGIHQLENLGGDPHIKLDNAGDFLEGRVGVRQSQRQGMISARE